MAKRIALVEDEPAIRENYQRALQKYGYQVIPLANLKQAEQAFREGLPDMAILDVALEDEPEGGFKLCQILRQQSSRIPIIFLTAMDSEFDIISGLRLGADDYITKDISLPHFMARVSALFRRMQALEQELTEPDQKHVGDLLLDLDRVQAFWQDQPVDLTLTEFWMVHALAKHPGHVKTREQLMETANVVVDDSTITSHIKRIRKKFGAIDPEFDRIETIYGMGYRWKP